MTMTGSRKGKRVAVDMDGFHPRMRVSKQAALYLNREEYQLLSAHQVAKALQFPDKNDPRSPGELTVHQLRQVFMSPPLEILKHHDLLTATAVPNPPQ